MTWVRDPQNDFINIAAAKSGEIIESRGVKRVRLKDERGNEVAIVPLAALEPADTVIAGPLAACFISRDGEVTWRAVAAWSVSRLTNQGEAILAGDRPSGAMFLELVDGSLLGVGCGRRSRDLKSAVVAIRADEEETVQ